MQDNFSSFIPRITYGTELFVLLIMLFILAAVLAAVIFIFAYAFSKRKKKQKQRYVKYHSMEIDRK